MLVLPSIFVFTIANARLASLCTSASGDPPVLLPVLSCEQWDHKHLIQHPSSCGFYGFRPRYSHLHRKQLYPPSHLLSPCKDFVLFCFEMKAGFLLCTSGLPRTPNPAQSLKWLGLQTGQHLHIRLLMWSLTVTSSYISSMCSMLWMPWKLQKM